MRHHVEELGIRTRPEGITFQMVEALIHSDRPILFALEKASTSFGLRRHETWKADSSSLPLCRTEVLSFQIFGNDRTRLEADRLS
jgi:hypothetical protein